MDIICSDQACTAAIIAIVAILSSLLFFFAGAISGGLCVLWMKNHRQKQVKRDHQLPSVADPVYEEMPSSGESTASKPISLTEASESLIEMETNAAYGDSCGQIN